MFHFQQHYRRVSVFPVERGVRKPESHTISFATYLAWLSRWSGAALRLPQYLTWGILPVINLDIRCKTTLHSWVLSLSQIVMPSGITATVTSRLGSGQELLRLFVRHIPCVMSVQGDLFTERSPPGAWSKGRRAQWPSVLLSLTLAVTILERFMGM